MPLVVLEAMKGSGTLWMKCIFIGFAPLQYAGKDGGVTRVKDGKGLVGQRKYLEIVLIHLRTPYSFGFGETHAKNNKILNQNALPRMQNGNVP